MTPQSLSLHIAVPVRGEPVIPLMPGPTVDIEPDAVVDHEVLVSHAGHVALRDDGEPGAFKSQADDRLVA